MQISNAIDLRNWMHQNPEPSGQEFAVTALLKEMCKKIPVIQTFQPLPTGLVAVYEPCPGQPYTLFRADLDALPLEKSSTTLQFGHSCGHDLHTAILWDFLEKTTTIRLLRNLIFLFQPAEESGGGALQMLRTRLFDSWTIQAAFALHVTDAIPFGSVASAFPTLFSASREINLEWKGVSAHITMPGRGKNAWQACYQFQTIWEQEQSVKDPSIFLGIGKVQAGHIRNTIPSQASMEMTLRGKTEETLTSGLQTIQAICESIQARTGVTYQMSLGSYYPPVIQDKTLYEHWEKVYPVSKRSIVSSAWTAEDFGFFTQRYPSLMCWLGSQQNGKPETGLHHPDFYPSSDLIPYGTDFFMTCLTL